MKKGALKTYTGFFILLGICFVVLDFSPSLGKKIFFIAFQNILFMLGVVPPIFILVGLFDVWVPREKVVRRLGEASGMVGIGIALLWGLLQRDHCTLPFQ